VQSAGKTKKYSSRLILQSNEAIPKNRITRQAGNDWLICDPAHPGPNTRRSLQPLLVIWMTQGHHEAGKCYSLFTALSN
jgi:hypothetical protein